MNGVLEHMSKNYTKKQILQFKIEQFFDENFLDTQGFTPSINMIDEQYLARILTKLAISTATVWWSILEVKEFFLLRKKVR